VTAAHVRRGAIAVFVLAMAVPSGTRAQQQAIPVAPELRADVIAADRATSVQGAVGLEIPLGYYVRVGLLGGAGLSRARDGSSHAAGRVDLLGRFLLDPFRQSRLGFSAGAGVSLRAESGDRVRPQLLVALELEGRRSSHGVSPSFQLGLGGGVRAGVALRWSGRTAR
jgi:hypothetical protein